MLKARTTLLWTCALLASAAGCGSDDTSESTENGAPEITDLSADQDAVLTLGTATISVAATDPDGDALTYTWAVTAGTLDATDGETPKLFTAPDARGPVTITVTVSDGNGGTAEETLELGVVGWVAPASAAGVPAGMTLNVVSFSTAEDGVAVGGSETNNVPYIVHFKNGAWADETAGSAGHLTAAVALAADNIWTGGGGGIGFHYDGTDWTNFTIPGGCVHGMAAVDANNIWVTPAEGQDYMRQYSGGALNAWTNSAVTVGPMNGVDMVDANDGWAVGGTGTAIRWNGTEWADVETPATGVLKAVSMVAANDGWIVGASGRVMHWDGAAWTDVATPAGTTALSGVHALAADDVWVAGAAGTIMHFDGTNWTLVPTGVGADLNSIYMVSPTDGWAVGTDSTILHLE